MPFESFATRAARRGRAPSNALRLSPEQQVSLASRIGNKTVGGLAAAGNVLDLPGSTLRDLATWVPGGIAARNPFDQWLSPTGRENRTSGRELLRSSNLAGRHNSFGNAAAGIGLEIAMDPLTYLTLGGSAVTKAGRVAKNAGLFDDTLRVATKKAGKAYGDMGRREARATTSLKDLIDAGGPDALQRAQNAAAKTGVPLQQVMNQNVGGAIGFGLPFRDPSIVLGGTGRVSKTLDRIGESIAHGKYSPVPLARQHFDSSIREQGAMPFQHGAQQITREVDQARVANKKAMFDNLNELRRVAPELADDKGKLALYLEEFLDLPSDPNVAGVLKKMIDADKANRTGKLRAGAHSPQLTRELLATHAARYASAPQRSASGRAKAINLHDPSNLGRAEHLSNWEGGRKTIMDDVMADPVLRKLRDAGESEKVIAKELLNRHGEKMWSVRDDLAQGVLPANPELRTHLARFTDKVVASPKDVKDLEKMIFGAMPKGAKLASHGSAKKPYHLIFDSNFRGRVDTSKSNWQDRYIGKGRAKFIADPIDPRTTANSLRGIIVPEGTKLSASVEKKIEALVRDKEWIEEFGGGARVIRRPEATDPIKRASNAKNTLPEVAEVEKRAMDFARMYKHMPDEAIDQKLFGNHPAYDALQSADSAAVVIKSAEAATDVLASLLRNPASMEKARKRAGSVENVSLSAALNKAGLAVGSESTPGRAAYELARKAGISPKQIFRQTIPKSIEDELLRPLDLMKGPKPVARAVEIYDSFLNLTKTFLTGLFPAFHSRNFTSGQFRNWIDGAGGEQGAAAKIIAGTPVPGLENIPEVRRRLAARGVPLQGNPKLIQEATNEVRQMVAENSLLGRFEGQANDMVGLAGNDAIRHTSTSQGILSELPGSQPYRISDIARKAAAREPGTNMNPLNVRGVRGLEQSTFGPAAAAEQIGYGVEGMNRVAPFVKKLKQGVHSGEAAHQVKGAQVDYLNRNFTRFENEVMRRLFPFYKFTRKNAPYVARELTQRPGGRMAQTIRTIASQRESGAMTPDYVAETASIPMEGAPEGTDRYLTGLGLMLEEPFAFLSGDRTVKNALLEGASRMTPAIKAPLEWATGQSFFQKGPQGGRSLDDLDPTIGRTLSNIGQYINGTTETTDRIDPVATPKSLEFLIGNSPLTRLASTARGLSDPRKTAPMKALQFLTGARITDVSPGARDAIMREKLSDFMKLYGGRQFVRDYLPTDRLEALSPQAQAEALQIKLMVDELDRAAKVRSRSR